MFLVGQELTVRCASLAGQRLVLLLEFTKQVTNWGSRERVC
jgi:hypothetical protein